MVRVRALYEEPANDFRRSGTPGWGVAIVSTIGGVVLIAAIPSFFPAFTVAPKGLDSALLVALFFFAEFGLWSRILCRQPYRVGEDWIQPAQRPLVYALRGQEYVIQAGEITNLQVAMSPYGRRLTTARLLSGQRVRLTPPRGSSEADAAADRFLTASSVRIAARPSVTSATTLDAPARLYKVTVLILGIAWLILSGVSVYLSLSGVECLYPTPFFSYYLVGRSLHSG